MSRKYRRSKVRRSKVRISKVRRSKGSKRSILNNSYLDYIKSKSSSIITNTVYVTKSIINTFTEFLSDINNDIAIKNMINIKQMQYIQDEDEQSAIKSFEEFLIPYLITREVSECLYIGLELYVDINKKQIYFIEYDNYYKNRYNIYSCKKRFFICYLTFENIFNEEEGFMSHGLVLIVDKP